MGWMDGVMGLGVPIAYPMPLLAPVTMPTLVYAILTMCFLISSEGVILELGCWR